MLHILPSFLGDQRGIRELRFENQVRKRHPANDTLNLDVHGSCQIVLVQAEHAVKHLDPEKSPSRLRNVETPEYGTSWLRSQHRSFDATLELLQQFHVSHQIQILAAERQEIRKFIDAHRQVISAPESRGMTSDDDRWIPAIFPAVDDLCKIADFGFER